LHLTTRNLLRAGKCSRLLTYLCTATFNRWNGEISLLLRTDARPLETGGNFWRALMTVRRWGVATTQDGYVVLQHQPAADVCACIYFQSDRVHTLFTRCARARGFVRVLIQLQDCRETLPPLFSSPELRKFHLVGSRAFVREGNRTAETPADHKAGSGRISPSIRTTRRS